MQNPLEIIFLTELVLQQCIDQVTYSKQQGKRDIGLINATGNCDTCTAQNQTGFSSFANLRKIDRQGGQKHGNHIAVSSEQKEKGFCGGRGGCQQGTGQTNQHRIFQFEKGNNDHYGQCNENAG